MKKYLIPIVLGLVSFFLANACKEKTELEEPRTVTVSASFSQAWTRGEIEQAEGSLNLIARWSEDDKIALFLFQDGKGFTLDPAKVYNISSDGKRCSFGFQLPSDISIDHPYDIYGLCDVEGALWEEEGFVFAKSQLKRMAWGDRNVVPVWFHAEGGQSVIQADFRHLGTYEILHVSNTSKAGVTFRHDGFDVDEPWYKSSENTPLKEDYDPTHNVEEPGNDASSGSVFIPAGSSEKILSWYVPRGGTIIDATLLATINGSSVRSSNTKNSSVRIQRGHVYHMYATWDGNELKFINNGSVTGTISVEEEKIEFGEVFVDETGTEYLTIHNNGTAEQKVKVSIEDYTYSSPFDLPGAGLDDGYVYKVVPAGGSRSVALSFRASSPDDFNGNALVSLDGSDKVECIVPLHGKSIAKPDEDSFHLAKNSIEIYVHTTMSVRIRNGSGDYDVVNENPDIVDYGIRIYSTSNSPATRSPGDSGGKITDDFWEITGKKVGEATLRLADKKTKEELTLLVKVELAPELTLARHNVELAVAERSSVDVLTGSEWYDITIDNPSVVSANFATISSGVRPSIYDDDRPSSGIVVMLEGLSVGQTTVRVKDMSSYEEALIQVTVLGGIAVPEIVDLGLSVKWASFNLGATRPEEYGDYYAWGETEPKYDYRWETYKWGNCWNGPVTKYCDSSKFAADGFTDRKTVLDSEDDVAQVNLGSKWRMPTYNELDELKYSCTWTWTTENGVNGYRVTSEEAGYTDKYIFLPAAGMRYNTNNDSLGDEGFYWSSSLYASMSSANSLHFESSYVDMSSGTRYFGFPVRPVYDDSNSPEIEVTPTDINFGAVPYGSSSTKYVTVKNIGTGVLSFSVENVSAPFSVSLTGGSLSPEASLQLAFTFTPLSATSGGGSRCTIVSNATKSVVSVSYSGSGTTPGLSTPEAVDMGLSVKWASFNLGATKPEEYGDYYAWGETEPKSAYAWSTYKWCNGPERSLTKYNVDSYFGIVDNKRTLDPEDDAAQVKLGGKWRMPTWTEQYELRDNCDWTWTTLNGVKGYKVVSRTNGNSIFLPAAGAIYGSSLLDAESDGRYWSSFLYANYSSYACELGFETSIHGWNVGFSSRYNGQSIRPVCDEPNHSGGSEPSDGHEGGPAGPPVGPDHGDDGDL